MFEPFAEKYIWNLSVNLALSMGAAIGEIDEANRPVLADASSDEDNLATFVASWTALADRVADMAEIDEAAGHDLSAAAKYRRACVYYMTVERLQQRTASSRKVAYERMLAMFAKFIRLNKEPCELVDIPYRGSFLPALLSVAEPVDGRPAPCIVFVNGLDGVKEMAYLSHVCSDFRARGVSVLVVDQPGVGGALRLNNLPAIIETEKWASLCVDFLQARADVDPDRIGVAGWSLGGYYAPRAAAFEPRFKLCVAWGANHGWGEMQKRRMAREGKNPVPHYWDHVMWVWGQPDIDTYMNFVTGISLDGVVERIRVPFLITHGENDRQIPVEYAHRSYDQATASPHRELRIFTRKEGGIEHISADVMEPVRSFIADWIADRFAAMPQTA
ncbi:dienelactone hydrolase [Sphingobium xenophagum]|uniref:Dienelactone hydrolase n=1 Tax=Sphingobium xenophagum TaxID=121428 RepID=A0ABU1X7B4_SPHXE|nr:alpha/beta fold hydrolase [Sphingobium xenophagum]MDR7157179.1 dienelactone hydrolase [Sphingobium xenophagum]